MVRKIKAKKGRGTPAEEVKLTPAQRREKEVMEKWEESRKMGFAKYILVKGTLAWGFLTIAIFMLVTLIQEKFSVNNEMLLYFLKMYVVFVGMGTLFGILSWVISEKKYKKYSGL